MIINKNKTFCYRIIHRDNLEHVLRYGLVTKNHINANPNFVGIGNPEVIDVRSFSEVKIVGYGNIGEYIPFYFTPRSIMLLNIITGYYAPKVPRRSKDELVVIRCLIDCLVKEPQWFFTNGQANDAETKHYDDLQYLNTIDWHCIQHSDFKKSDGDYDRQRRYQSEFLVRNMVSIKCIESVCVYNDEAKSQTEERIKAAGLKIQVNIIKEYFFD